MTGMREEKAAAHADTRRHFEVLTEGTRKDIQIVAESVLQLSEKLDRTAANLDGKIDRTAAETRQSSWAHPGYTRCTGFGGDFVLV